MDICICSGYHYVPYASAVMLFWGCGYKYYYKGWCIAEANGVSCRVIGVLRDNADVSGDYFYHRLNQFLFALCMSLGVFPASN